MTEQAGGAKRRRSRLRSLTTEARRRLHMRGLYIVFVAAVLALSLLVSGAFAQATRTNLRGVSTTPDNQILVELAPEDTSAANPFDLSGRTVVFRPDGQGGYSRVVGPGAWVQDIGPAVADSEEIQLGAFTFDFAGREWRSFFVSRYGLITFGKPLAYSPRDLRLRQRLDTMATIASLFVTDPTISPLFKPLLSGPGAAQHVVSSTGRVVVTWITTEPEFYVHGVPPAQPSRFQLELSADGSIKFHYSDVPFGDGIVGLFPYEVVAKGDLIVRVTDAMHPELPGHLDLLDVAIYKSNTDALIVEWTMRDTVPTPPSGTRFSYRLYFDTDRPYFDGDWNDIEFTWSVDVATDHSSTRGGRRLPTSRANQIALLVEDTAARGITAAFKPDAAEFDAGGFVQSNWKFRPERITLPNVAPTTDLSRSDRSFSRRQGEVFHYRGRPDPVMIVCRVVEALGDVFDLLVFHSQFRVDVQDSTNQAWWAYGNQAKGIGARVQERPPPPCGEGRLKGHWIYPVWIKARTVIDYSGGNTEPTRFDRGIGLFAHEVGHVWTAFASYDREGVPEPLFESLCKCHWREDLHVPAAFPWDNEAVGTISIMGGRYWRENGDGTFTPWGNNQGGSFSWLDLYAMGLADAWEVPDMYILRNLRPVNEGSRSLSLLGGRYTGDKEIVSIEQVVAANGPRIPSAEHAQKDFNAAFVYLLGPGQVPDPGMLRLHAEHRDKVIEHWSHITGGRSRITTSVPVLGTTR